MSGLVCIGHLFEMGKKPKKKKNSWILIPTKPK